MMAEELESIHCQQFVNIPDPEKMNQTTLEFINEDLLNQAARIKKQIRNYSANINQALTPNKTLKINEYWRLGTAQTVNPSKTNTSQEKEFIHPWAMTVKSRSIRVKTDINRRHSIGAMSERPSFPNESMFSKITIHCLRSNREDCQQKAANLQSHCNYTFQKLEHLKWQKVKGHKLSKRIKQQRQAERKQSEDLHELLDRKSAETKYHQERQKQRILDQRTKKQRAIENMQKQKTDMAFKQRLASYSLKTDRKEISDYQMYQKRLLCQKEKQSEISKQRSRKNHVQKRKLQAKVEFRNRWIKQFQLASKAQTNLTQKQHIFAAKMQKAIVALTNMQSHLSSE